MENLYIEMIKKFILGSLQIPFVNACHQEEISLGEMQNVLKLTKEKFSKFLESQNLSFHDIVTISDNTLINSLNQMGQKTSKLTMCSQELIDNVEELTKDIIEKNIPGNFIEAGTFRGGLCILMKAILRASSQDHARKVILADSFQGLPEPDPRTSLKDAIWHEILKSVNNLSASLNFVKDRFKQLDLLDEQVVFLPGWFENTLSDYHHGPIALLRLDADWFSSTKVILESLYQHVVLGGYIIVDDYGLPTGCAQAVDEFRDKFSIKTEMIKVGKQAVYWTKES